MRRTRERSLLCAALCVAAGLGVAGASRIPRAEAAPTFITTAQGRGADLNIRGGPGFSSGNFGDHEVVRVRSTSDLGNARKTYLRFDLSSLPSPAKDATGAALGLRIAPSEGKSEPGKAWAFNVFGLRDSARDDATRDEDWGEKAASWQNAPANDATSPSGLRGADVVPLGAFTITGAGVPGQAVRFSSPALLQLLKDDTNKQVTLIITRQEAGEAPANDVMHIFASKEAKAPAPPVLSVAYKGEEPSLPGDEEWARLPVAQKAAPWESDILAFEAQDRAQPPAKGGVVFVGSSSIRLWKSLEDDFPGHKVLNRGFGGSHVIDSARFADRIVTPYEPQMIVFYAGTNDLASGLPPERVLSDYMAFVSAVRAKMPSVPIAFISVAPAPSRWANVANIRRANGLVAEFSKLVPNLQFIDIFPLMLDANGKPRPELFVEDQLHMKPEGYAIWKKAVAPFLPKP